ncbi:MAG: hypothetical protein AB3N11_03675 [Arenibacterium sp.]
MTKLLRLVFAGVLAVLFSGVAALAATAERLSLSWLAMTESCLTYAETGARAPAFGSWHVAADDGEVCDGGRTCESDLMTFIGAGELGLGAVTVAVGAADWAAAGAGPHEVSVGDQPTHMSCFSAAGIRHQTGDIVDVHRAWIAQALDSGRFIEGGVFASVMSGPYLGCGYDGRAYQIEFSLHDSGSAVFRLYFPAREKGAEGTGPSCTQVIG